MIPLATAVEMQRAEHHAIETLGVPSVVLMENAGRGAADAIERAFGPLVGRRLVVVAGKGNNGGDGFVVARHLAARAARVSAWLVGAERDVRGDAATNLAVLRAAGLRVTVLDGSTGGFEALRAALAEAAVVVDALLGTGASGAASGPAAAAIEALNASGRTICALDLPSGLAADHGRILGPTVRAHLTVTFGLPKVGLYLHPGASYAGRVELVDLGLPRGLLEAGVRTALVEAADVRGWLPARPPDAHKGRFGHLLVVAGSLGKTGAAVLACLGALRAGTGLVTCALPRSQQPVVAASLAEVMTEPLDETASGSVAPAARDRISELAARMDAVALGPGAGLVPETLATLRDLVSALGRPTIVDADALTALAGRLDSARGAPAPRLFTPHPGEAARLLGIEVAAVQADRLASARRLAELTGGVVALKGAGTLVATPDGDVTVNPTGNAGMATAGMGDVLTGLAAGLLAQGMEPAAALRAAVYLHGRAGDLVAAERGGVGLLARDVADAVPRALRDL